MSQRSKVMIVEPLAASPETRPEMQVIHFGKLREVKINEAPLFKVKTWCRLGRLQLSLCKCVCVRFKLSRWGKCGRHSLLPSPWKPRLFHRRRGRAGLRSESGVWFIPHYFTLNVIARVLLTVDGKISEETKMRRVFMWKHLQRKVVPCRVIYEVLAQFSHNNAGF